MGNEDFDGYEVTTINPGEILLHSTALCCIFLFLVAFYATPGKFLHPFWKRWKENVAWVEDLFLVMRGGHYAEKKELSRTPIDSNVKATEEPSSEKIYEEVKKQSEWKEAVDQKTGKIFYFNHESRKRTWRKPLDMYESQIWKKVIKRLKKKNKDGKSEPLCPLDETEKSEPIFSPNKDEDNQTPVAPDEFEDNQMPEKKNSSKNTPRRGKERKFFGSFRSDGSPPIEKKKNLRGRFRRTGSVMSSGRNLNNIKELDDENEDLPPSASAAVPIPNAPPSGNEIARESRKILGLGIPWMFQSIIADGSSILSVMMISHFMGLRDMLVYSNVWFIIYLAFVMNDAWYNSLYKHVNVSAALGTDEGYAAAGKYIKIGLIGNIMLAIPLSALAILYIPDFLLWIGYEEETAEISRYYTAVAVANNIFDTTFSIFDCMLDIDGHATFGAVYDFWNTIVDVVLCFMFIMKFNPSLFILGLFQFGLGILSTIIYFVITHNYCRWFDRYINGLSTTSSELNWEQVGKLVKMTMPMILEAIIGNIEHTCFTIFAAYQGTAEAATWVLLSYVWSAVGIAPDSYTSAASCRVARLISKGDIQMAQNVSKEAMKQALLISVVCAALIYFFRVEFVWCFSLDETLEQMLLEIIPYITLCYPFITLGGTAMELNDALHLFKRSMVTMAIVTVTIMVPLGYVMTYIFYYNIEGLASAQCIGYTAAGVINIIFYVNANWEKAASKAHDITEAGATKKCFDGQYDDYDWDDLPEEVRFSAQELGYDKEKWDGDQ